MQVLDISGGVMPGQEWVAKSSKKEVEILDNESLANQQIIGTSMFLVFVDDSEKSQKAIEQLEAIEPKYGKFFSFYSADSRWEHRKSVLGI